MFRVSSLLARGASLALVAAAVPVGQAHAASAQGSARAEIAQPIAIQAVQALNYGTIVPSGTAGTVTVATDGARTFSGGVSGLGGSPQAARFDVSGQGNATYSVTLPAQTTLSDGSGNSMTADQFNHDAGSSPQLSSGSDSFSVGAALNVGANQTPNVYTGTFQVTVAYN